MPSEASQMPKNGNLKKKKRCLGTVEKISAMELMTTDTGQLFPFQFRIAAGDSLDHKQKRRASK